MSGLAPRSRSYWCNL